MYRRDARGGSQSVFVLLMIPAIIMIAGLVVDGGRKVAAAQRAESAASASARVGQNAAALGELAGRPDTTAAVSQAQQFLARTPNVSGSVRLLPGGRLEVTTQSSEATLYLRLIGITSMTGRGQAVADLIETGGG